VYSAWDAFHFVLRFCPCPPFTTDIIFLRRQTDTEYGKHAVDIAHKVDLDQVDALIVVSGDGVLHEVVNGLLTRPDWEQARRLPVGIIPAGSGNAFATSVGE